MKTYYVLSCDCGKTREILPTQAGVMIPCACGKVIEAPPSRELLALPAVQRQERTTAIHPERENLLGKEGGTRQRRVGQLLFAGIFGSIFAIYGLTLYVYRPRLKEFVDDDVFKVWEAWQRLRAGVNVPMDRAEYFESYAIDNQWRWIFIMGFLTAVCVLWILAVLLAPAVTKKKGVKK